MNQLTQDDEFAERFVKLINEVGASVTPVEVDVVKNRTGVTGRVRHKVGDSVTKRGSVLMVKFAVDPSGTFSKEAFLKGLMRYSDSWVEANTMLLNSITAEVLGRTVKIVYRTDLGKVMLVTV